MNVVGGIASAVIDRRNCVRIPNVIVGATILVCGALLIFVTSSVPLWLLILLSLLFGITTGPGTVGNQAVLYDQAPEDETAVASGLLRPASYIGAI